MIQWSFYLSVRLAQRGDALVKKAVACPGQEIPTPVGLPPHPTSKLPAIHIF